MARIGYFELGYCYDWVLLLGLGVRIMVRERVGIGVETLRVRNAWAQKVMERNVRKSWQLLLIHVVGRFCTSEGATERMQM